MWQSTHFSYILSIQISKLTYSIALYCTRVKDFSDCIPQVSLFFALSIVHPAWQPGERNTAIPRPGKRSLQGGRLSHARVFSLTAGRCMTSSIFLTMLSSGSLNTCIYEWRITYPVQKLMQLDLTVSVNAKKIFPLNPNSTWENALRGFSGKHYDVCSLVSAITES